MPSSLILYIHSQVRVREYFHYCRALQKNQAHQELLNDLSPCLLGEVSAYTYGPTLENIRYFQGADADVITRVAVAVEPTAYPPGEIIFRRGDVSDYLYLIKKGTLVSRRWVDTTLEFVGKGNCFGEEVLMQKGMLNGRAVPQPRIFAVSALTYVDTVRLARKDLEKIMKNFPHTARKMYLYAMRMALLHWCCYQKVLHNRPASSRHAPQTACP